MSKRVKFPRSLTALALLIMLPGCPFNPMPAPPVPVQSPTPAPIQNEVPLLLSLIDSASGELVSAKAALSVQGDQSSQLLSENGIFQLTAPEGSRLNLVVRAPGYYPSSLPVRLQSANNAFEIKLTPLQASLKGFAHGETTLAADGQGRTQAELALSAENRAEQVFTRISLPAGTQLRDALGQKLEGELQVQIGSFGPDEEGQTGFPAGLDAPGLVDGQVQDGYFAPAAYASIELSDGAGRQAAHFDRPMQISTRLSGQMRNPKTGQPIQQGESLEIWSYDTQAGQWRSEGEVKLPAPNAEGDFEVGYEVSHLSYWYLGWRYYAQSVCNARLRFVWAPGSQPAYPVEVRLKLPSQSFGATNVLYDELNTIYDAPRFSQLLVVASSQGVEIGRATTNLEHCSPSDELRLNVDTAKIPKLVNVTFSTKVPISWPFHYRNLTQMNNLNYYQWRSGFMVNGKVTLPLLEGDTYEFRAIANTQLLSYKLRIEPGMRSFNLDAIDPSQYGPHPLGTPTSTPQPLPAPTILPTSTLPGQAVTLLDTSNRSQVRNGPTAPARFSLSRPHTITRIFTYHWNDGKGTTSIGQHSIVDSRTGKVYGPWQAGGSAGQGGTPNANWQSSPNETLPAGEYVLVDSDPMTWSHNAQSGGRGMGSVSGVTTP